MRVQTASLVFASVKHQPPSSRSCPDFALHLVPVMVYTIAYQGTAVRQGASARSTDTIGQVDTNVSVGKNYQLKITILSYRHGAGRLPWSRTIDISCAFVLHERALLVLVDVAGIGGEFYYLNIVAGGFRLALLFRANTRTISYLQVTSLLK